MHGSRGSVERKSSTVTADRDAFARTKPCVEVFTGYQSGGRGGEGLGCNAARKMMKQVKGFPHASAVFKETTQGKRESNSADLTALRQALRVRRATMTARQVSNKLCLQLRVRAAR